MSTTMVECLCLYVPTELDDALRTFEELSVSIVDLTDFF